MQSPLRFQLVTAVVAIGAALVLTDGRERPPSGPVLTIQDRDVDESSGLLDLGATVATVNDSGGDPVVFILDKKSGRTVGRTTYADDAVDVEALALGPAGSVWVGDIGDNGGRRPSVSIYRLPPLEPGDRTVAAQRFDLTFATGPRDAEALLVHPVTGRVYVVSKGLFGGQVFAAPRDLRTDGLNVLRPVAGAPGLVTDGAFLPDGRHAILRTYSRGDVVETAHWGSVASFRLPQQPQGEGLAVPPAAGDEPPDHVLVSSEGVGSQVLAAPLPAAVRTAVAPPPDRSVGGVVASAVQGPPRRAVGAIAVLAGLAALVALLAGVLVRRVRAARRRSRSTR